MNASPLFTILTASLNSESTIDRCLQSVKEQTYKNLEHIVIDGGSDDRTVEILQQYEKRYNLKWLSEPDNGIADALNKGLALSRGRYIIVIQADDRLLSSNILNDVYPLLNTEETDLWSFPIVFSRSSKGDILKKPIKILWWNHFKFIFLHQGCLVHRRAFEKIGHFRTEFTICMDYDFFYRALACGLSIKFGKFPVALMGGGGIGSDLKFIKKRLAEEKLVQIQNEPNRFWKTAQSIFRRLYMPYKKIWIRLAAARNQ